MGNSSPRRIELLCAVLVATLACWNCRDVLGFQLLVWDDDVNLTLNPFLGAPTWERLRWMFTDIDTMRRYIPLGWLGFSCVYAFSGLSGTGFHAANLILHAANSALLYFVLRAALRRWYPAADSDWSAIVAMLAAALWALHPFRVETVGWASGLLYAQAGFFMLLAALAYLGPGGRRRLVVAGISYLCSILTYPVAIGGLGILILIDVVDHYRGREVHAGPRWGSWVGKGALLVGALGVASSNLFARLNANEFWMQADGIAHLSIARRALRAMDAIAYYLWKPWWPMHLTPMPLAADAMSAAIAACGVVGITVMLAARPAWRRGPFLFWLGFLGLLAPTLGMTEPLFFPCDRYLYLPAMVVSAAVAVALLHLPLRGRALAAATMAGVIAWFGILQRAQLPIWHDTDALHARIVSACDQPALAEAIYRRWVKLNLQRWNIDGARAVLAEAEKTFPRSPLLTPVAADVPRFETAKRRLDQGGEAPEDLGTVPAVHERLAENYAGRGEFLEAREHFEAALAWAPDFALARFNFAIACALEGKPDEALHRYLGAIANGAPAVSTEARQRALGLIAEAFAARGQPVEAQRVRAFAAKG